MENSTEENQTEKPVDVENGLEDVTKKTSFCVKTAADFLSGCILYTPSEPTDFDLKPCDKLKTHKARAKCMDKVLTGAGFKALPLE